MVEHTSHKRSTRVRFPFQPQRYMGEQEKIEKIIEIAKSLIDTPYNYGASLDEAPAVFDCSGFIQYLFAQVGVELPRSTILQAAEGTTVAKENILPGDLMFLHGERGYYTKEFPQGIGHVVLYTGGGKVIQAASRRVQDHPKPVVEEGAVVEMQLEEAIQRSGPLVVIKRILA